ncbi:MAG: hypothetical protein HY903_21085 [Deltaproteobacteria bacterium]|nr:hypothetical protein [Deltaproteobacteria bacterium]
MTAKKSERLSAAYDTLKRFGFDARGIESHAELVAGFQPLREQYKDQPDGRAATYDTAIRPAFVAIANGIKKIHPKLHRNESTRIIPGRGR